MDSEIKQKWVDALRSGKYKQGKSCLRRADRYDVLGVLCDVHDPDGWGEVDPNHGGVRHRGEIGGIGREMREEFGFEKYVAIPEPVDGNRLLTQLNDKGYTFEQIADIIDKQF